MACFGAERDLGGEGVEQRRSRGRRDTGTLVAMLQSVVRPSPDTASTASHDPMQSLWWGLLHRCPAASCALLGANQHELNSDISSLCINRRVRALHNGQDCQLGKARFDVAHDLWSGLLCRRDDARCHRPLRSGSTGCRVPSLAPSVRCDDRRRYPHQQDGSCSQEGLRSDA